ncbi:hypothetical protein D3C71_1917590 [compost metagenome]
MRLEQAVDLASRTTAVGGQLIQAQRFFQVVFHQFDDGAQRCAHRFFRAAVDPAKTRTGERQDLLDPSRQRFALM